MKDRDHCEQDLNGGARVSNDTLSLLDLLSVIARRKWLILIMTFVVAVVTVAFLALTLFLPPDSKLNLLPNVYKPTVKILVQEPTASSAISSILSQSSLGSLSGLLGTSAMQGKSTNADLAQALLESRTLMDWIAEKFDFVKRYQIKKNPKTNARGMINHAMKIEFDEKSGILEIGYEDIDRVFATDVVNALADQLQIRFKRLTVDKAGFKRQYLEEAVAAAETQIDAASAALVAFQNKYGIYDMNAQAQATINAVASQKALMATKQVELQLQMKYLPESDARIVRLKDEIEAIKKLISQLTEGGTDFVTGTVPQNQMPALGVQYLNLQRDLQAQQAIISILKQQYETAKLEEMDTSKTFQVVEIAEVPEVRSGPSRTMSAIIVTVVAFFLSILLAFFMEYLERAKHDPVESEKLSVIRASLGFRKKLSRK
jgi:tyrosine-protein kinase Etk/Wzc